MDLVSTPSSKEMIATHNLHVIARGREGGREAGRDGLRKRGKWKGRQRREQNSNEERRGGEKCSSRGGSQPLQIIQV